MCEGRERKPALGCDWLVLSASFPAALALPAQLVLASLAALG